MLYLDVFFYNENVCWEVVLETTQGMAESPILLIDGKLTFQVPTPTEKERERQSREKIKQK